MSEHSYGDGMINGGDEPPGSVQFSDADMVRGRVALILIALMVLLADITIYHAAGFSGPAAFFIGAVILLYVGIPRRSVCWLTVTLTSMLAMICFRLACNGSALQIAMGFWLLHAMVLSLRRQTPFVVETVIFAAQSIPGGYDFLTRLNQRVHDSVLKATDTRQPSPLINVVLPAVSAILFGGIFVMANPDVVRWISGRLGNFVQHIRQFLFQFSYLEVVFWMAVAWLTGGLLRPIITTMTSDNSERDAGAWGSESAPLFDAFRNTLLTVIVLFGAYLAFEFYTLWFRTFPKGFHYSGYAHQGAAWLTVALAMATVMLSLIFRGIIFCDHRLPGLKRLAWIWSALNFILAIAVYHRLLIYIEYNGMTRMRVVGLLGITSVVLGFALVLIKISRRRAFLWLIRRQLWVVGFAAFVYAVLPVDVLIHQYNVSQILSGNHAPVVQITQHPVDDEALQVLLSLTHSNDPRIRAGIQAMLEIRLIAMQGEASRAETSGWTAWQKSSADARMMLSAAAESSTPFDSINDRRDAWIELQTYSFANWW
ncbi:MAG: DUF4153 domain-containing protein [Planctomycetaceae bacterium]